MDIFISRSPSIFTSITITSAFLGESEKIIWKNSNILLGSSPDLKAVFKGRRRHHPNFIDGETEAQQRELLPLVSCQGPCPCPHSPLLRGWSTRPDKCWSGNKYSPDDCGLCGQAWGSKCSHKACTQKPQNPPQLHCTLLKVTASVKNGFYKS